jgi:hypothetical protein
MNTDHGGHRAPILETGSGLEVAVETVPPGWPLTLLDIGSGGFLVSGPRAFPVDEAFDFWFHIPGSSWSTGLTGRAIYAHERTLPGHHPVEHVCGFAFISTHLPLVRQRIADLVDRT